MVRRHRDPNDAPLLRLADLVNEIAHILGNPPAQYETSAAETWVDDVDRKQRHMRRGRRPQVICILLLACLAKTIDGQGGLLRRDDAQAGLTKQKPELTNMQAADKADELCIAGAKDMMAVQACDAAEIDRRRTWASTKERASGG